MINKFFPFFLLFFSQIVFCQGTKDILFINKNSKNYSKLDYLDNSSYHKLIFIFKNKSNTEDSIKLVNQFISFREKFNASFTNENPLLLLHNFPLSSNGKEMPGTIKLPSLNDLAILTTPQIVIELNDANEVNKLLAIGEIIDNVNSDRNLYSLNTANSNCPPDVSNFDFFEFFNDQIIKMFNTNSKPSIIIKDTSNSSQKNITHISNHYLLKDSTQRRLSWGFGLSQSIPFQSSHQFNDHTIKIKNRLSLLFNTDISFNISTNKSLQEYGKIIAGIGTGIMKSRTSAASISWYLENQQDPFGTFYNQKIDGENLVENIEFTYTYFKVGYVYPIHFKQPRMKIEPGFFFRYNNLSQISSSYSSGVYDFYGYYNGISDSLTNMPTYGFQNGYVLNGKMRSHGQSTNITFEPNLNILYETNSNLVWIFQLSGNFRISKNKNYSIETPSLNSISSITDKRFLLNNSFLLTCGARFSF
jgi:hypothetical protein